MNTIQRIAEKIEYAIMVGEYRPRQHLVEAELADRFSVSRTIIRESLRILHDRGVVITYSNKGSSVVDFTAQEIRDLYFLRLQLEESACLLGFPHITAEGLREMEGLQHFLKASVHTNEEVIKAHERFHEIIFKASGNPFLTNSIRRLITLAGPMRYRAYITPERRPITLGQHDEIIQAIKAGDKDEFVKLHYNHVFESLKIYLTTYYPQEAELLLREYEQMRRTVSDQK